VIIEDGVDKKKLIKLFINLAEKLQKVPSSKEIEKDPELPKYEVFRQEFGKIRESEELSYIVDKYRRINKINKTFCSDCIHDPEKCGKNKNECKKKAEIYYSLYNRI